MPRVKTVATDEELFRRTCSPVVDDTQEGIKSYFFSNHSSFPSQYTGCSEDGYALLRDSVPYLLNYMPKCGWSLLKKPCVYSVLYLPHAQKKNLVYPEFNKISVYASLFSCNHLDFGYMTSKYGTRKHTSLFGEVAKRARHCSHYLCNSLKGKHQGTFVRWCEEILWLTFCWESCSLL